ncbi:hypothetical protein Zmor_025880 [Zophobas morio]|uniref:Uncharacterized protein n=1 Tax=Zophobas morio TaxID=2755281 RepID=A0AA38HSM1_9CUCU|nr:hypothetical protein Zmor_025880 [Zophobas morio]
MYLNSFVFLLLYSTVVQSRPVKFPCNSSLAKLSFGSTHWADLTNVWKWMLSTGTSDEAVALPLQEKKPRWVFSSMSKNQEELMKPMEHVLFLENKRPRWVSKA